MASYLSGREWRSRMASEDGVGEEERKAHRNFRLILFQFYDSFHFLNLFYQYKSVKCFCSSSLLSMTQTQCELHTVNSNFGHRRLLLVLFVN